MRISSTETIAAISTAIGEGGIGIVRISGPDAVAVAEKIITPKKGAAVSERTSHTVFVGAIVDPASGSEIDEVLVTLMRAPHTYTREDVVEINCHGGTVALRATLRLVLEHGARAAEPGEFTKRAFLNGRIDLAQAEAVIDIIRSRSEVALKAAVNQLEGGLSEKLSGIAERVAGVLTHLEAAVDFSDEDVEVLPVADLLTDLREARRALEALLSTATRGRVIKEGIRTAIVGRPNVGKSSLLNALLKAERAIVTAVPGTTRDVIEETVLIKGIPLLLKDTAGIRVADDEVERIGVELSKKALKSAELVLCVVDGSRELEREDRALIEEVDADAAILVVNKADIAVERSIREITLPGRFKCTIEVSALTGKGVDVLERAIEEIFAAGDIELGDTALITNARHEQLLGSALAGIDEAIALLEGAMPEELASTVLNDVLAEVGEITGETVGEDILGRIFSQFCIGK